MAQREMMMITMTTTKGLEKLRMNKLHPGAAPKWAAVCKTTAPF